MLPFPEKQIFSVKNQQEFEKLTWQVFHFQAKHNPVYKKYIALLGKKPTEISQIEQIPFLPIEFFKTHSIKTGNFQAPLIFTSSGTSGTDRSQHFVAKPALYEQSFLNAFRIFYGNPQQYCFLALLPSYLERKGSSLIYMIKHLVGLSPFGESGFFLRESDKLIQTLKKMEAQKQKTILFGVSFALLDFAERYWLPLKHTIVMDTGGMKGRRKEITRPEMHQILQKAFGVAKIHSEYGMTELLSQAYSQGEGKYSSPPWQKILIRDIYDPFTFLPQGKTGGINVIDLSNVYSCAFIETADLGRRLPGETFEVLGRLDHAEIRGCNLLSL